MAEPAPLVSVLMVTYNHERYVRQAVESACAQVTDFEFEIVVGEDRSTDGTRAVLLELQRRYPSRIRLFLRDRNLGVAGNWADTLSHCRGRYVAVLEGDDYWTDPQKLARQVAYLEAHAECALCFHNVLLIDEVSGKPPLRFFQYPPAPFTTTRDLIANNFIPTCSVLFRRAAIPDTVPDYIRRLPMQDWPMWMHISQSGQLGYVDFLAGCYRVHPAGIWSRLDPAAQLAKTLQFYAAIEQQFPVLAAAARDHGDRRRIGAAVQCLELRRRGAALRILASAWLQGGRTRGIYWLSFEALFGSECAAWIKRTYRQYRGLDPA